MIFLRKQTLFPLFWLLFIVELLLIANVATLSDANFEDVIGYQVGDSFLYKNEHYFLDESGKRTLDVTKWSKLVIDNINQTSDGEITNVYWSKYDAVNYTLKEIEEDPSLLEYGFSSHQNYWGWPVTLGEMVEGNPLSKYQVMFNEKGASMEDVPTDVLIDGHFSIFYLNEMGYYDGVVDQRAQENNTIVKNNKIGTINEQKTRTFDANVFTEAQIQLNSSYPEEENAWHNITLDLKLYLVYGLESNILLSYNINFTIAETIFNPEHGAHEDTYQRKIIFWNIRQPDELTEDYPIIEVLDIPTFGFEIFGYISITGIVASFVGLFKKD
jgi:hypothetical protein